MLVQASNERHPGGGQSGRLKELGESPLRVQAIVVDDCSSNQTPSVLQEFQESLGADTGGNRMQWMFLRHERNQSIGGAIRTPLQHADCELTVLHDADLEYHPRDLMKK